MAERLPLRPGASISKWNRAPRWGYKPQQQRCNGVLNLPHEFIAWCIKTLAKTTYRSLADVLIDRSPDGIKIGAP